jgi:hypothetical protein
MIPRAGLVAALLVALLSPPAGAQPFAPDAVPPWVRSDLEVLAAHGLLAPQAVALARDPAATRTEVAALVAEALLRAQDTGAATEEDVALLRALLAEFERELASLSVRVRVAEETLRQIAEEARRVRISGDVRLRYDLSRAALNNPGVGPVLPASAEPLLPSASTRWRLLLDGGVTDALRLRIHFSTFSVQGTTVGLWGGIPPLGHLNSPFIPFGSALSSTAVTYGSLEWRDAFHLPLDLQLGRIGGDSWEPHDGDPPLPLGLAAHPVEALQLGPVGLLLSTARDPAGERTLRTHLLDAFTASYRSGQVQVRGVLADVQGVQGSYGSETLYGLRIQSAVAPDVAVGLNAVLDTCNGTGAVDNSALVGALTTLGVGRGLARCSFVWWGAENGWTPSLNTGTTNPYTNIPGSGYSVDVDVRLSPSLRLQGEWGLWGDPTAGTTGTGWQAQLILGAPSSRTPGIVLGYQSFDPSFYPPLGGAEDPVVGFIYPGGFHNAFAVLVSPLGGGWVLTAGYEVGTSLGVGPQPGAVGFGGPAFSSAVCERCSPAGQPFAGWLGALSREIAPQATLRLYYFGWQINGASQADVYRVDLSYRF